SPACGIARTRAGAHREDLIERGLAVQDVPAPQGAALLEVGRGEHLARHDQAGEIGRVVGQRALDRLGQRGRRLAPLGVPQRARGAKRACTDIACAPGGASEGSATDGSVMSRYGRLEIPPYLASSKACSSSSIDAPMWMRPASMRALFSPAASCAKRGRADSA